MRLNKLLQTQIKRFLPANSLGETQMVEFINAVSNTYNLYQKELPTGDPTCSDDGVFENRLPNGAVKEIAGKKIKEAVLTAIPIVAPISQEEQVLKASIKNSEY